VISPTQRPLPDNTQHSQQIDLYLTTHDTQQTDIHAPGKIRTHNPSRRAAADRRLRPRSHWDWPSPTLCVVNPQVLPWDWIRGCGRLSDLSSWYGVVGYCLRQLFIDFLLDMSSSLVGELVSC